MITVKCQECGTSFEAQRTSAKFCSANCRVKFNSRNTVSDVIIEDTVEEKPQFIVVKERVKETESVSNEPYFKVVLKKFNDLVENNPSVSSIKSELLSIREEAINNSELNYRQTEAITARVDNYINGDYGSNRKKNNYINDQK